MIPIHLLLHVIVQNASATASGCRVRRLTCCRCGRPYIYQLRRKATGTAQSVLFVRRGMAKQAAEVAANGKLQKILDSGVDPVPCPDCGTLQENMIPIVRRKRLRVIVGTFGVAAILLALLWMLIWLGPAAAAKQFAMVATVVFAGGLIVALAWALLGDLNAGAHRRTRTWLGARCRSMPAEEFDALLADGGRGASTREG